MDINNLFLTLMAVLVFVVILVFAIIIAIRKSPKQATEFVEAVLNSPAILNVVEAAGKNVDPSVVVNILQAATAQRQQVGLFDEAAFFEKLKQLIIKVTDGQPNPEPPSGASTPAPEGIVAHG